MIDSPIHILYIDDEPNNVVSFRATFRREFNVYATTSISEAFELLEKHSTKGTYTVTFLNLGMQKS